MAVIDELILRKGTTRYPIDSYDNKMIDEIVVEGQKFHFAKQKDLTGTSEIVADNGVDEPIISLGVSGDTFQQTYSGKNLFNKNDIDKTRALANGSSAFSTASISTYNCAIIPCSPNTTYIKSGDFGASVTAFLDSNEVFLAPASTIATGTPFTTPSNCAFIVVNVLVANAPYDNCQIEKGSVVTQYEQYVGGKYSPNPEFPQPIENTNDNGMSVVLHGTNLATAYQIFADRNKYTELEFDGRECIRYQCDKATDKVIEGGFKENTQYTLSCEAYATVRTGVGNDVAYLYIIYYTDGTRDSVPLNTVNTWEYSKFTTKSNKTVATISMRVWSYMKDIYVDVNTFQINEGTQVLPYEPYFRETIEIPTSITLNGKNVSLLFSEYDKLTVDRIANKVKYYEGGVIHTLTGNETAFTTVSGNGNNYRVYFGGIGISGDFVYNVGYCSHFAKAQWSPLYKQGTYATRISDIIFRTDGVEMLDEFKAFLQEQYANGTPVTFIIQRKTSIEYDITNTDLGQSLLALATRKGTNYVEISSDLAPSQTDLSYWRQIIPNE